MVAVQVGAYLRMYARGAAALLAGLQVLALHHVHVCAGASQVAQVSAEVRHLRYLFHLAQDALFGAAHDELALVRRYGTEGTSSEAPPVHVHRELYHVVCRYALPLVFGVRHPCVGQVETVVQFLGGERWVGRVHHNVFASCLLYQARGVHLVAFLLHVAEVLGMESGVLQTFFVGVQDNVPRLCAYLVCQDNGLRQRPIFYHGTAESQACHQGFARQAVILKTFVVRLHEGFQAVHQFQVHLVAHAVGYHVGAGVRQYRRAYALLPIVVVRHAP